MESTRTTKGAGQRETGQSSRLSHNSSTVSNGRPGGLHLKERPPLKQKDSKMNRQNSIDEQREMATGTDTAVAERKRLAQCGFTSEEIGSVLWLRQWYQSGGSDRVAMVRRWEFLKLLVMYGKLEA
jgi:hypothetical protein